MLNYIIENAATIATIFFFLAFCYIVYSVFKKGSKKKFDEFSQIPFKDEKKTPDKKN